MNQLLYNKICGCTGHGSIIRIKTEKNKYCFLFFISNKMNKDKASSVMDGHKIINFIYATYIYRTSHPL